MEILDAAGDAPTPPFAVERIGPDAFGSRRWPVLPGDYCVFDATKPVALVLLQNVGLDEQQGGAPFSEIAIAGRIATENLGVERLVKNMVANPYLRHLVLWGDDIEGHLPGDALLNLSMSGCDEKKRIIGARGARPVLKNLTKGEVSHFRKQVRLTGLIGQADRSKLASQLEKLAGLKVHPYEAGLTVGWEPTQRAKPAKRLKLDPAGYFVILVVTGSQYPLLVEHYSNDGRLRNRIEGTDAASICATLIEKKLITQLDHAAYMGRELAKAEMSIVYESTYVQDRAQGDLPPL